MPPRKSKTVEPQNLESMLPEEEIKQKESTQGNQRRTRKVSSKSTPTPTPDLKNKSTNPVKVKPPHLVKGSEEARKRMSELRAMRKPKQPKN